jgi:hypothetical protein
MSHRRAFDRFAQVVLVALLLVCAGSASAQTPQDEPPVLVPGEVQRLLDAYAIVQGQEFLSLTDTQYAQFISRLKALQEVRRRNEQARLQLLQQLLRMTNARAADVREADLKERLKALQDLEARSASELQKAYESIDQVLDVRQQARFRVFEEQMERRKLELLMRARNAPARLGGPRGQRPPGR